METLSDIISTLEHTIRALSEARSDSDVDYACQTIEQEALELQDVANQLDAMSNALVEARGILS